MWHCPPLFVCYCGLFLCTGPGLRHLASFGVGDLGGAAQAVRFLFVFLQEAGGA